MYIERYVQKSKSIALAAGASIVRSLTSMFRFQNDGMDSPYIGFNDVEPSVHSLPNVSDSAASIVLCSPHALPRYNSFF